MMGWKYIKMLMVAVLRVEDLLFGSRPNIKYNTVRAVEVGTAHLYDAV